MVCTRDEKEDPTTSTDFITESILETRQKLTGKIFMVCTRDGKENPSTSTNFITESISLTVTRCSSSLPKVL